MVLHVHNTTATADSIYYVQTDLCGSRAQSRTRLCFAEMEPSVSSKMLGSWDRIVDGSRTVVQSSHYDPWGNRMSASDWSLAQDGTAFSFHRGFTGHEHYDRFGIINMNARLYDPVIARFFSPDPQVQNPTSTQGFNRYTYCGNNPVMNTDPDGEFLISMAVCGGLVNYFIHKNQGDISSCGAGWGYFAQGALGGLLQGITWVNAISLISIGSPSGFAFVNATTVNIISTTASTIGNAKNALRILGGRYYFDENMAHGFGQALTRFTTELPQTWLGYNYTQFRNICCVHRVDYFGGATFSTYESPYDTSSWGVSIGNNINIKLADQINGGFREYVLRKQLYMHEYGHTFQSQYLGLSYLLVVGIPSLISASCDKEIEEDPYYATTHNYFFSETWANRIASNYFKTHYGYSWVEKRYPLHDYR